MGREERDGPIKEILFQDDPFWQDPARAVYDPKTLAWLDSEVADDLQRFLPGASPGLHEPVKVAIPGPQRVEIDAVLERPGLLILSDIFYPGWKLTVDGVPATIYRANRMMRAAALSAGKHHLVYTYEPRSFQVGGIVTIGAIVCLMAASVYFSRRPISTILAPTEPDPSNLPLLEESQVLE